MIFIIESLVTSLATYMLRIYCSPVVKPKSQKTVMFSNAGRSDRQINFHAKSIFLTPQRMLCVYVCGHSFDWHWLWSWKYERIEY